MRAEEDHPVLLSHFAKCRSLMPSLALIVHLIDGVDAGTRGPISGAAADRAAAWCEYLAVSPDFGKRRILDQPSLFPYEACWSWSP